MKFVDAEGEFDVDAFRYAARLTITAQEILVDNSVLPHGADRGELAEASGRWVWATPTSAPCS